MVQMKGGQRSKSRHEMRDQVIINLDGVEFVGPLQQVLGKCAAPRAYFDDARRM